MALDTAVFLHSALARGVSLDVAPSDLRRQGATPIDSIKAVREARGVSLGEAKRLLAGSPAWEDMRGEHERFVEEIAAALEADS